MLTVVLISQALLYICFAIVLGGFLLALVPPTSRPDVQVPKGIMMLAVGGISVFSFMPVLQIVLYLYNDSGFASILQTVLFTFEIGKAWIFTYIIATVLFLFVVWFGGCGQALYAWVGIGLTFVLILAMGWSSHASSYDPVKGFFNHTAHVTVVSVWVGVLLVVSWFSKNHENWLKFLSWFTPVALVCLLSTVVTGLVLMSFATDVNVEAYANAWLLPYGQALLIKHLLLIPLLVYAMMNGLFMKKKVKNNPNWDPRPWAKVESFVMVLIFSATAVLGQQSPPHETVVTESIASKLFLLFYQGAFRADMTVQWVLTGTSVMFFLLAALFIVLMLMAYWKKAPAASSFFMGIMVVLCGYFGLIWSIQ